LAIDKPIESISAQVEKLAVDAPNLLVAPTPELSASTTQQAAPKANAETKPEDVHATDSPVVADGLSANGFGKYAGPTIAAASARNSADVTSKVGAVPNPYGRRGGANDRLRWAEQGGGGQGTEKAVNAALAWLAKSQSPDGRWDASRFGAGHEMAVLGQDRGGAGADADAGVTALAILAFLGAGDSDRAGEYQATVRKGIEYIVGGQSDDGCLGGEAGLYARMYSHSMATFALAEALAMTGDAELQEPVRRALNYSLRAQNPSTGGWRYRPGDSGDTSQLGWQLMALWSAERAGIPIPPQTWTGAERFLRSVRRGQAGGLASYRADSPSSVSMTAEALYCRQLVGETLASAADEPAAAEAIGQIVRTLPEPGRVNLYYWYYASLALHRQQQRSDEDALAWKTWNEAMSSVLVAKQSAAGDETGSWDPDCIWGGYGGRVYSTALSTLCLEVYYRYAPIGDAGNTTAARSEATRVMK
jgi:hypothetical protein